MKHHTTAYDLIPKNINTNLYFCVKTDGVNSLYYNLSQLLYNQLFSCKSSGSLTFESVHPAPKSPSLLSLFNREPFQKMSEWDIENKLEETGPSKLSTLSRREVLMPTASRKSRQVATFLWLSTLAQAPIFDNLTHTLTLFYLCWKPGAGLFQKGKKNLPLAPLPPTSHPLHSLINFSPDHSFVAPGGEMDLLSGEV